MGDGPDSRHSMAALGQSQRGFSVQTTHLQYSAGLVDGWVIGTPLLAAARRRRGLMLPSSSTAADSGLTCRVRLDVVSDDKIWVMGLGSLIVRQRLAADDWRLKNRD